MITDDCRYLKFDNYIFSLDNIKHVQYNYEDGKILDNKKIMKITYWDDDTIELVGIIGCNKKELDEIYKNIEEVLLNKCYEQ